MELGLRKKSYTNWGFYRIIGCDWCWKKIYLFYMDTLKTTTTTIVKAGIKNEESIMDKEILLNEKILWEMIGHIKL